MYQRASSRRSYWAVETTQARPVCASGYCQIWPAVWLFDARAERAVGRKLLVYAGSAPSGS